MTRIAFALLVSAAAPSAAEPFLDFPLDCIIGETCFVEDYADIDPGPGDLDYTCGQKARDGHNGTDFALPDMPEMERGVAVLAAADGIVEATRDSVPDAVFTPEAAAAVDGRECGNAVRIGHANGYKTLYCHLAQGSIRVSQGDRVTSGQPLGDVGLSGLTTFPHLHFAVLTADGQRVDPFHPGATPDTCAEPGDTLWRDPVAYEPTGFFTAGFANAPITLRAIQTGEARAAKARPTDPLVLYAYLFDSQAGDTLAYRLTTPTGDVFTADGEIDATRARDATAFGWSAPEAAWPTGQYRGQITLTRDGALIGARQAYITVGN